MIKNIDHAHAGGGSQISGKKMSQKSKIRNPGLELPISNLCYHGHDN